MNKIPWINFAYLFTSTTRLKVQMKADQGHADAILRIKDHQLQTPEDFYRTGPSWRSVFSLLTLMIVMEQHFGRLWSNATVIFFLECVLDSFLWKSQNIKCNDLQLNEMVCGKVAESFFFPKQLTGEILWIERVKVGLYMRHYLIFTAKSYRLSGTEMN